ncbi:hypothetical protein PoB_002053400 [Plakobranchus ocellatus]|uniref:Uncharacterized protein n=1 Tax=Plakobranchus ocellatus TaxID=259542 RepID=A0AAV3ZJG0_9GAST|nr:hypothetical protein PoB_002053400 [Plakobranchus ocellatus]
MISDFQLFHQARVSAVALEPVTEGSPADLRADLLFAVPPSSQTTMLLPFYIPSAKSQSHSGPRCCKCLCSWSSPECFDRLLDFKPFEPSNTVQDLVFPRDQV